MLSCVLGFCLLGNTDILVLGELDWGVMDGNILNYIWGGNDLVDLGYWRGNDCGIVGGVRSGIGLWAGIGMRMENGYGLLGGKGKLFHSNSFNFMNYNNNNKEMDINVNSLNNNLKDGGAVRVGAGIGGGGEILVGGINHEHDIVNNMNKVKDSFYKKGYKDYNIIYNLGNVDMVKDIL